MNSPFAPTHRIVTGHTPDGQSIALFNDRLATKPIGDRNVLRSQVWLTNESPADNSQSDDTKDGSPDRLGIVPTHGSSLSTLEFPPNTRLPLHRTSSIDYIILISGEITVILDDGVELTIKEPGSIIVQRGTFHGWVNKGTEWARYIAVVLNASPVPISSGDGGAPTLLPEFV